MFANNAVDVRRCVLVTAVLSCMAAAVSAGEPASTSDVEQANNPLANFAAFNVRGHYIGELTDPDKDANQL
jgi:hypothetical protein